MCVQTRVKDRQDERAALEKQLEALDVMFAAFTVACASPPSMADLLAEERSLQLDQLELTRLQKRLDYGLKSKYSRTFTFSW